MIDWLVGGLCSEREKMEPAKEEAGSKAKSKSLVSIKKQLAINYQDNHFRFVQLNTRLIAA